MEFDKNYYEQQAAGFSQTKLKMYKLNMKRYRWLLQHLLTVYDTPEKVNILDIGVQDGQFATGLAMLGFNVIGIDIADMYVTVSNELKDRVLDPNLRLEFVQADICNCKPFLDKYQDHFHAIYAFEVLEHVPCLDTALSNISHILKNGGVLFTCMPNELSWDNDESHIRYFYMTDNLKTNKETVYIGTRRKLHSDFNLMFLGTHQHDLSNSWIVGIWQKQIIKDIFPAQYKIL